MPPDEAPATDLSLVLTTEASAERAEALARQLLERGLVACVSLHPVVSLYRWQGRLERSQEMQLLLKTTPQHLGALRSALLELHGYDTPEWIHWNASSEGAYGCWCLAQVSRDGVPPDPAGRPGDVDPTG
jgi:periplasmic divalent cation tolerance protein